MIPLSTLRDPAAFLGSAPLPLVDLDPTDPGDHWIWTGTWAVRLWGGERPEQEADRFDTDRLAHLDLALDPDDPTIAAHLDLQIARHWTATRHPAETVLWAGLEVDGSGATLRMLVTAYGCIPSLVHRAVSLPRTVTDVDAAWVYLVGLYFGVAP